ncbi:MAG: accessory factor UbiK family protein [Thiotrichales bacterium]
MLETKNIDELIKRVTGLLPESATRMQEDVEKNIKGALTGVLQKMDLVTREEYEVQAALLERSRARLNELEARIAELEKRVLDPQ